MRDREYADKLAQLESMRDAMQNNRPAHFTLNGKSLSGIYNTDIEALLAALATERARAEFLDNQSRALIAQLESSDRRSSGAVTSSAELREALADTEDAATQASNELVAAEARIADAENRLNSLLSETTIIERGEKQTEELLADKLKLEDQVERLKGEVLGVEGTVMADWDSDRVEQAQLREKLNDIASDVSRLVYALDGNAALDSEESLFDRVQKFAGDVHAVASAPVVNTPAPAKSDDKPVRVSAPPKAGRSKKTPGVGPPCRAPRHPAPPLALFADDRDLAHHLAGLAVEDAHAGHRTDLVGHRELPVGRHRRDDLGARRDLHCGNHVVRPGRRRVAVARCAVDKRAADRDKADDQKPDRKQERAARAADDGPRLRRQFLGFARFGIAHAGRVRGWL